MFKWTITGPQAAVPVMGVTRICLITKHTDVLVLRLSSFILFHLPFCFFVSFWNFHGRIAAWHLTSLNVWDQYTVKKYTIEWSVLLIWLDNIWPSWKKNRDFVSSVQMPTYSRLVELFHFNFQKLDYFDWRKGPSHIGCNIQFMFNGVCYCIGFR